jgi:hypothetical protein
MTLLIVAIFKSSLGAVFEAALGGFLSLLAAFGSAEPVGQIANGA